MLANFAIILLDWYISNVLYHIQCMVYGMECMESVCAWECAKMHEKQR